MQDIEDITAYVEKERQRYNDLLDNFLRNEIERVNKQKQYYDRALEDYTRRTLESSNKKTLKLPYGNLALRKQQPHYEYSDDLVIEWAKDFYPDMVKVTVPEPKISIDKKELKKQGIVIDGCLYINGELVPGVTVEVKSDKFEIK
jgi:hypothetical protein